MKKNIFAITAAAALVLNIAATSVTSFAATDDGYTVTDTQKSDAKISLKAGTDADGKGGITLKSVPNVNFQGGTISTDAQTFTADSIDPALVVENAGVDAGWRVQLAAGAFTSSDGNVLKGAELTLAVADAKADINNTISGAADATSFNGTASTTDGTFSQAASTVLSAASGKQGVGVNTEAFAKDKTTLAVPAGNVAGDYTSKLTWTLATAPAVESTTATTPQ